MPSKRARAQTRMRLDVAALGSARAVETRTAASPNRMLACAHCFVVEITPSTLLHLNVRKCGASP